MNSSASMMVVSFYRSESKPTGHVRWKVQTFQRHQVHDQGWKVPGPHVKTAALWTLDQTTMRLLGGCMEGMRSGYIPVFMHLPTKVYLHKLENHCSSYEWTIAHRNKNVCCLLVRALSEEGKQETSVLNHFHLHAIWAQAKHTGFLLTAVLVFSVIWFYSVSDPAVIWGILCKLSQTTNQSKLD